MSRSQYRRAFRRVPGCVRRLIDRHSHDLSEFMRAAAGSVAKGAVVVDVGAGESQYRDFFRHTRYVAVDFALGDPEWDYSRLDVVGDLLSMPLATGAADAAICTQVLEHVPDPGRVLTEVHRVLKPGARLYLTAPQGWAEHQQPHDYFRFTSFALRMLFERAGFEAIDIRPLGGYFVYVGNRVAQMPKYLFSGATGATRLLLRPLELILLPFLSGLVPIICNALDRFDHRRDFTLGYAVAARKPAEATRD